jgi:CRISP-associated protein Cas1
MSLSRQSLTLNRLKAAFAKVQSNSSAAGIDGVSPNDFGVNLIAELRVLQTEVLGGTYVPLPLRRAWLRVPDKKPRPLAIPAVRDRVLQTAVAQVLMPIFEAEFEDCSFAYRQGRGVRNAIDRIGALQRAGFMWVVDADITQFFNTVPHLQLFESVARVVSDKTIQHLIQQWVQTPIIEGDWLLETTQGIPQGSPISPMLSNLYLDHFDDALIEANLALVRYADDFVVLTKTRPDAEKALELTETILKDLALGLNPLKTGIINLHSGLDYLGWHIVGSFAVKHSRKNKADSIDFELSSISEKFDTATLAHEKVQRLKPQTKYTRLADQAALTHHYLTHPEPLDNSALADGLLPLLPQLQVNTDAAPDFPAQKPEPLTVAGDDVDVVARAPINTIEVDLDNEPENNIVPAKALQRTLYLVEQGCELSKEAETFQVRKDGELLIELPARAVDVIVVFGNISLTTPAMQLAMRHQVTIALLSHLGRYYGRIDAHDVSALNLQKAQSVLAENQVHALKLAKVFVTGKLANSRVVLSRYLRSRTGGKPEPTSLVALQRIRDAMRRIKTVESIESLRGLEGAAASDHFEIMRHLLGPQWQFTQRARHPSPDAINALLSLGYTLLYQCVAGLLQARGLNPHIGFMHTGSGTHLALASDVMEEFRAVCVDALVLKLCATSGLTLNDFGAAKTEGFQLNRKVVRQFIKLFEARLGAPIQHPVTGEQNVDLRQIIDTQVLQLIRLCRAPDDAMYVPCIFR